MIARVRASAPVVLAALLLATPAAGQEANFKPRSLLVSRATLAGVNPKSSLAQIKAAWGPTSIIGPNRPNDWGRSIAIWRPSGYAAPTVAKVAWARSAGVEPIKFSIDLVQAKRLGFGLRTPYGVRAGTPLRVFRKHWPHARRVESGPNFTYYAAQSSYRGWLLVFLMRDGRLMYAELMLRDFFNACYVKPCPRGYPPPGS